MRNDSTMVHTHFYCTDIIHSMIPLFLSQSFTLNISYNRNGLGMVLYIIDTPILTCLFMFVAVHILTTSCNNNSMEQNKTFSMCPTIAQHVERQANHLFHIWYIYIVRFCSTYPSRWATTATNLYIFSIGALHFDIVVCWSELALKNRLTKLVFS